MSKTAFKALSLTFRDKAKDYYIAFHCPRNRSPRIIVNGHLRITTKCIVYSLFSLYSWFACFIQYCKL